MNDVVLLGLLGLTAGVMGGSCVAVIVWKLSARRQRERMATFARAREADRDMLALWQCQQQNAFNSFQAMQAALMGDFLRSVSSVHTKADVSSPTPLRVPPTSIASTELHSATRAELASQSASKLKPASTPHSARPPEMLLTPVSFPECVPVDEAPTRELSDAEIDALSPELPNPALSRRRVLPTPKLPVMRSL